ncbi:MAG TPA: PAS domain-containing protein, partial [Chromatiales bacterium]|nr:PAS domain-containing protein [Chromatiales bacterium]
MRVNEPVTDHEVVLGDDQTLVSYTNLKGIITYADPDFIAVSGFSEKELTGKNHNLVRHPDMPPEAFQDLWDTIRSGSPWTGIVKNRCKNGDYYWVEANVTPVYQRGRVTGYLSVRRKATRQQIEEASELYAAIREGTRSMRPQRSRLSLSGCNSVSLKTQLLVQLGGIAGMTVATVAAAIAGVPAVMLACAAITLGCAGGMAVWFSRRIAIPLNDVRKVMRDLGEGDYFSPIDLTCSNEIGQVMRSLKSVQIKLGSDLDAAKNRARQATRVRQALDNVSTPVMVGDANHDIIYMNQAAEQLFTDAESDIQKDLPDFDASTVLGSNIDIFHKEPEHQRQMLDAMKSRHTSAVQIGGRTLKIVANPVCDDSGQRIGTAVEWTDKTAELAIEEDVQRVVNSALSGDLSRRIPLDDKEGFFEKLSKGINELVGI